MANNKKGKGTLWSEKIFEIIFLIKKYIKNSHKSVAKTKNAIKNGQNI